MVEGGRLESVCTARYRGFKSLLLRQILNASKNIFCEILECIEQYERRRFQAEAPSFVLHLTNWHGIPCVKEASLLVRNHRGLFMRPTCLFSLPDAKTMALRTVIILMVLRSGGCVMAETDFVGQLDEIYGRVHEALDSSLAMIRSLHKAEEERHREIRKEIVSLQQEIGDVIDAAEESDKSYKAARNSLIHAVRSGSEEDQRKAYERAEQLMRVKGALEEREKNLQTQREFLTREERRIADILKRSDEMGNKFRIALDVLKTRIEGMVSKAGRIDSEVLVEAYRISERDSASLGRDLHDGPAQKVAAAMMFLDLTERWLDRGDVDKGKEELQKSREQMREAVDDVRMFLFQLNPRGIDEGIDIAIRRFSDQVVEKYGIPIRLRFEGKIGRVEEPVRSHVFKIVHQAVVNALRNAKPREIRIHLGAGNEFLWGKISDDGVGFNVEEEKRKAMERGSYGLLSMEERVMACGGTIAFDSAPGKGTTVTLRIPLRKGDDDGE